MDELGLLRVGSSDSWKARIEKRNVAAGFDLVLQEDPYLPTDVTAFYPKEIPVLSFFTGSHEDYNRPTDDAKTLNYEGMERITRFAYNLTLDLVSATSGPDYAKVERTRGSGGERASLRAYLGTIPDFANEVEGYALQDVAPGGPAEKSGMKAGDVIVQFGESKIGGLEDIDSALRKFKAGDAVKVIVKRGDEELTLEVILGEPR